VLTEFNKLSIARRFCERADPLADWSRPAAELEADAALGLQLHRAACAVTGLPLLKPELRIVLGGIA
jgi:hypothetical protein